MKLAATTAIFGALGRAVLVSTIVGLFSGGGPAQDQCPDLGDPGEQHLTLL